MEAIALIVTAVAIAGIAMITVGVLSHLQITAGVNVSASGACFVLGSASFVTAAGFGIAFLIQAFTKKKEIDTENVHERLEEVFKEKKFSKIDQDQFTADINSLTTAELQGLLDKFFKDWTQEQDNPLDSLKALAKILPQEALEAMTKRQNLSPWDAIAEAKLMCKEAKDYLDARSSISPTFYSVWLSVFDTFIAFIDNFLSVFGVADFFKPSDGSVMQSELKFQKITMIISFFTLLTATLLPMFGVTTGASIVGGTILLIAILSVIWPHIRPTIPHVPHAENWTQQVQMKNLWTSGGRKEFVADIAANLVAKKHTLLLGPSGIGKTQTVISFVEALERGEFPELSGKKVFYFNTADLVDTKDLFSAGNNVLKKISEAIGRHREECILVFDEIHHAYDGKTPLGEQLKTYLDEKAKSSFPYVIGLTTVEEYDNTIYKHNAAADRRFLKEEVAPTDVIDTESILSRFLLQEAPEMIVEPGALRALIDATKGKPQPLTAKRILSQCIGNTKLEKSDKIIRSEALKKLIENAGLTRAVTSRHAEFEMTSEAFKLTLQSYKELVSHHNSLVKIIEEAEKSALKSTNLVELDAVRLGLTQILENELNGLDKEIKDEKQAVALIERNRKLLAEVKETKYKLALEIGSLDPKDLSASNKEELNRFTLLNYFLEKELDGFIREKSPNGVINESGMTQILETEKRNDEKRRAAVDHGREQKQSRLEFSGLNGKDGKHLLNEKEGANLYNDEL